MSSLSNNNLAISTTTTATNLNFGNDSNVTNNPNLPYGFVHRGVHHPDINAAISQFGLGFGHDLNPMHAQGLSEMVEMASTGNHHLFPSSALPDFSGYHHNQQFQIPTTSRNSNLTLSPSSTPQGLQQSSALLPTLQHQTLKDSSFSPLLSSSSENNNNNNNNKNKPFSPMSATALLQKAAQMGSTRSNSTTAPSFFAGPTMTTSSSPTSPPPPRSSSPMMIQQERNNFNTNVSRENHNVVPLSDVTTTSTESNPFPSDRSGLNSVQHMALTRDFLGVSSEHRPHQIGRRSFYPQELARFAPMD